MQEASKKNQSFSSGRIPLESIPVCAPFPHEGNVRANQAAPYLGISVSTFRRYVREKRIKKPMRYGARAAVWNAQYIRLLAENSIPEPESEEVS